MIHPRKKWGWEQRIFIVFEVKKFSIIFSLGQRAERTEEHTRMMPSRDGCVVKLRRVSNLGSSWDFNLIVYNVVLVCHVRYFFSAPGSLVGFVPVPTQIDLGGSKSHRFGGP